jgi:hypothetical protein
MNLLKKIKDKLFPETQTLDLTEIDGCIRKLVNISIEHTKRLDKMDELIKKDKKKMDNMMNTLVKKDIPRDKKIKKCDKMMKEKK